MQKILVNTSHCIEKCHGLYIQSYLKTEFSETEKKNFLAMIATDYEKFKGTLLLPKSLNGEYSLFSPKSQIGLFLVDYEWGNHLTL